MKKISTILFLTIASFNLNAQQQYIYTNFLLNDYYFNSAIVGSKKVHEANIGFRKQWAGFTDSPLTLNANYYGSYKNQMKHGYGVSLITDKTGLMQRTGVYINYAYHIKLTDKIKLGVGVKPGYLLYNIKLYNAQLADINDDILTGNVLATNALDLSSGINLYSDKFFVRAGMQQILGQSVKFTDYNDGLSQHFTFIAGYNYEVKKQQLDSNKVQRTIEKFVFQPSIMINHVKPLPTQISVMFKTTYNEKVWLGLNFRSQDAVGLSLGLNVNTRLTIGYGYDYSFGQVKGFQGGSHEIMLRIITTNKVVSLDQKDEDFNNSIFEENKKGLKKKK